MKYCGKCGHQVVDDAVVCTNCGCAIKSTGKTQSENPPEAKADPGLIILSISIPLAGVILWIAKNKEEPQVAGTYGALGLLFWILGIFVLVLS